MISITIDLREATAAEAESYMNSQTRQFLLYRAAEDLSGAQLTIRCLQGGHFVEVLPLTDEPQQR